MDGIRAGQGDLAPLAQLNERLEGQRSTRLGQAVAAGADALHGLVAGLRPSGEEFRVAIDFLTEVGHAADQRRQEWVLLADVLGVSTLVENLNAPRPPGATPNTLPGPFYRPDVPEVPNGADLSRDGRGEPMRVTGRLRQLDGRPVGGALVELWQANAEGLYENQDPDRQPEFNLRGRLQADAEGRFEVRTVRPGRTRLPGDGPVGRLIASLGLGLERPAHLHVRVTAPGFEPLVTHVFDRDDPLVGCDPIFGVKPALLHSFRALEGGGEVRAHLDVTLTLCAAGVAA
jgi:protocatechuate 3,4-dioxygenase beta subunit